MVNTIVIENQEHDIKSLLKQLPPASEVNVLASLSSVKQSVEYFSEFPEADLIFSDVHLPDGLAFDIFSKNWIKIPVIFITSSKEFEAKGYETNGIDFLLKPLKEYDLQNALHKYHTLQQHFTKYVATELANNIIRTALPFKKTKLVVKRGIENVVLKLEDIVMIYTQDKVAYVIDNSGAKYISNKNLGELEVQLDNSIFFRINRQCILNVNYIKSFKSFKKVKLLVDISLPVIKQPLVISQETSTAFRKWVNEI